MDDDFLITFFKELQDKSKTHSIIDIEDNVLVSHTNTWGANSWFVRYKHHSMIEVGTRTQKNTDPIMHNFNLGNPNCIESILNLIEQHKNFKE